MTPMKVVYPNHDPSTLPGITCTTQISCETIFVMSTKRLISPKGHQICQTCRRNSTFASKSMKTKLWLGWKIIDYIVATRRQGHQRCLNTVLQEQFNSLVNHRASLGGTVDKISIQILLHSCLPVSPQLHPVIHGYMEDNSTPTG